MTKNDGFYKILFAIEIALLPMIIFAHIYLPKWSTILFILGVFVCKVWREIFKDRKSRAHSIINSIATVADFSVILIYFSIVKLLNLPLIIVTLLLIVMYLILNQVLFTKRMPETIDAVDFCFIIFEAVALISLAFVVQHIQPATISMWSIILATSVSIIYKVYYLFKYEDLFGKIKNVFKRK